jgi:exopolysaccharide biosynthesis protein
MAGIAGKRWAPLVALLALATVDATPAGWPLVVYESRSEPQRVAAGVTASTEFLQTVAGPLRASLLDVDLANPDVRLGVVAAHDRLFSADETVSSMAARTHAVAGINGDYFEINASGRPINMVAIDGRLVQSAGAFAVLGVTRDRRLTMAHESFSGTVADGAASHALSSVNVLNDLRGGGLVLASADLGATIPLNVSDATIAFLRPGPAGRFSVTSVVAGTVALPLLEDQVALVGGGASAAWLTARVHAGDELTIDQRTSPDDGLAQAVGGGPILVRNGALFDDPDAPAPGETNVRNPLTAVAVRRDGRHALMVVFAGRQPNLSIGLTRSQMASYLLRRGAFQAMLFDSGGSSEMVARLPGQRYVSVLSSPSDGHERPVANGLFVYSRRDDAAGQVPRQSWR